MLLLSAAALLPACGDDDERTHRDTPNKAVKSANLGEPVSLRSRTGEPLVARVVDVRDPVREHPFEDARIVSRFVGIILELRNDGEIAYRGSPWSGSRLSTTRGAERPTLRLKRGSCVGVVRRSISPGGRLRLCIPFLVERDAKPLKFRYTPEAGFAPAAAVWDLGP